MPASSCAGRRADEPSDDDLLAIYRTLDVDQLNRLLLAFELDLERLTAPESKAFCERRLRLIQQVLNDD